ncbi:MAG: hypothetical protein Q8Q12_17650, partial [bacterium]|nr:hypothetical protein [bacterium]
MSNEQPSLLVQPDVTMARDFLERIYGDECQGYVVLWNKRTMKAVAVRASDHDKAAAIAIAESPTDDVYFAVCTQAEPPRQGRGTEDTALEIPGFYLDIDFMDSTPETVWARADEVLEVLNNLGTAPS